MRAFEIGELDDYDRGVFRSLGRRPVARYRPNPGWIEPLLVRVPYLFFGRAVTHHAANPFCGLRARPARPIFADALRHRDGHAWARRQELKDER
jgi:hypothetical protein